MQWNQPFGGYGFPSSPKTVLKTMLEPFQISLNRLAISGKQSPNVPPNPQILGEGDVTAITFPDGSVKFYFVPIIMHDHLPYYCNMKNPYCNSFCWPNNTQAWFVRSIIYPQENINFSVSPEYFNNQVQSSFGEYPLTKYLNAENTPAYPEYLQKFHNDVWTSTTDILYFYPNLRREKYLHCKETQTEMLFQNSNLRQNTTCNRCLIQSGLEKKQPVNIECMCHQKKSSVSCMSVDSDKSGSERRRNKKQSKRRAKNTIIKKVHYCKCKEDIKDTSDKFVTTFVDQGTSCIAKNGCETQTERPRQKKEELRAPNKRKAAQSNSTLKLIGICQSCNSGSCTCNCSSTSNTDGE